MIAGTVVRTVSGAQNTVEIALESLNTLEPGQRVVVAVVPDDRAVQAAYKRGKADGITQERRALEEFADRHHG